MDQPVQDVTLLNRALRVCNQQNQGVAQVIAIGLPSLCEMSNEVGEQELLKVRERQLTLLMTANKGKLLAAGTKALSRSDQAVAERYEGCRKKCDALVKRMPEHKRR